MNRLQLIVFSIFIFLFVFVYSLPSFVVELTATTFDGTVATAPHLLVRFEKSWCVERSSALLPFFLSAAQILHHDNPNLFVGSLNASRYYSVSNRYHLMEFPAIILLSEGKTYVYDGDHRKSDDLRDWAQRLINPQTSIELIKNERKLKTLIKDEKIFISYVTDGSKEQEAFYQAVRDTNLKKQVIYEVNDPKLTKSVGQKLGTLVSYYTDTPSSLAFPTSINKIRSWLSWELDDILEEATIERLNFLKELGEPYAVFTLPEGQDEWLPRLEKWGEQFRSKLRFLFTADEENTISYDQYGISLTTVPSLVVYNTSQKFVVWNEKQEIKEKEVIAWLKRCLNGQAKSYERTEAIPLQENTSILKLVGSNFRSYLTDPSEYLLVFVYNDGCRTCVRIAETLKTLVPLLKDHIRIARFNVELNAHPVGQIFTDVPNLLLYSPHNSTPEEITIPYNLFNIYSSLVSLTRGKLELSANITFSYEDIEDDDSFDNYDFIREEEKNHGEEEVTVENTEEETSETGGVKDPISVHTLQHKDIL